MLALTLVDPALAYLVQHWHLEFALFEGAPVLIMATLAISLTLGWLISRFAHQTTINGLREHVGMLEAHVTLLADELKYVERRKKRH